MSTEDIMEELKGGKVTELRRLPCKRQGIKTESLSILLQFEGQMPDVLSVQVNMNMVLV
uniref:Uncharacterized protein n=1 Tax=Anguilla anguilla TaxID=7936 RepID=A0A0E9XX45_ANGAN